MRLLAALALIVAVVPSRAAETDCLTRDPSTIVKRGDTYWIYGTGLGTAQFSSKDKVHWTFRGPCLPNAPDWLERTVPGNKNYAWAPDVRYFDGRYWLYSAYSLFGKKTSSIGVATSTTLEPNSWVEQGLVVHTTDAGDANAIDPCIFQDADGRPWLSYGSYWTGIKLIQIDPNTGLQAAWNTTVTSIAGRPGVPGNAIEASCVTYHNGYYTLFVNWDSCCAGSQSKYNVRMGRSRAITGPYLDRNGKDMRQGGGTLFLGAVYDDGSGRPPDDEVGPGHVGILHDVDSDWVSTHDEWARDRNGATTLNVQRLAWDTDGWPRAVLDSGPYKVVSFLSTHEVLTCVKGPVPLQTWPDKNTDDQAWTLTDRGDGFYSVFQNGRASQSLTVLDEPAKPESLVSVTRYAGRDTQLWFLRQNEDGTYTLLAKAGGRTLALGVGDCSLTDGSGVGLWTSRGNNCQKWSFHRR